MQIGQSPASFQLRFDAGASRTDSATAEQQAKRTLAALSSAKLFEDNQRVLSGGVRTTMAQRGREPLYREAEAQLAALTARLGDATFASGQGFEAKGPLSVRSADRLNLGEGRIVQSTTTTSNTTTTATPAANLDATAALSAQSFATAVTAGTISVTYQRNDAAAATTATITIDPTRTLGDTLADFATATGGAVTAALSGNQIVFSSTSTSGDATTIDLGVADGTSNFVTAISGAGLATTVTATATALVDAVKNKGTYDALNVTIDGVTTSTGALTVTDASTTDPTARAQELAGLITAGLTGTGITATANAGTLQLTYTNAAATAGAPPAIGIDEGTAATAAGTKGGKGKGGGATQSLGFAAGGFTATTTSRTLNSAVGGLLGTSSTLRDLAGQLGLSAINGQFQVEINGETLSFSQEQTLDDVLTGINASKAGVVASYDADDQRISIESTSGERLRVSDRAGNLAGALGVAIDEAESTNAQITRELEGFANALNDAIALLKAGTGEATGLQEDGLLQDLQAALQGLFTGSGGDGLQSLGDLGFTLGDGAVSFDAARLAELASGRLDDLNLALGSIVADRIKPLLNAGAQALQDASALAPVDAQAAAQAVRVRGDLARLQTRQQMLALEQLNYQDMRERLERQDRELERIARELERRNASGLPQVSEDAARVAQLLATEAVAPFPPIAGPAAINLTPGPGLTSFGLGQSATA